MGSSGGRACRVCVSEHLAKVNLARFRDKLSYDQIVVRFSACGFSYNAIIRHFSHMPAPPEDIPDDRALVLAPRSLPGPGRKCSVCDHPHRDEIESAITMCMPKSQIALEHGCHMLSIQHHTDVCMPELMERSRVWRTARPAADRIEWLLEETGRLLAMAKKAAEEATTSDSIRAWGGAVGQAERVVTLLAKLSGETTVPDEEQVMRSPLWRKVSAALTEALLPYPDAARAVANELGALKVEMRGG